MSINDNAIANENKKELPYRLRLFVAGSSPVSIRAINNLQALLEEHLGGRYELEIIDVHQQPDLALTENITAVPMLVKSNPGPRRLFIGDMSDTKKLLRAFGLI